MGVTEVGIDERSGLETQLGPIDFFRESGGDFPAKEGSSGAGVGKSCLEELVVGLVDGIFGHLGVNLFMGHPKHLTIDIDILAAGEDGVEARAQSDERADAAGGNFGL